MKRSYVASTFTFSEAMPGDCYRESTLQGGHQLEGETGRKMRKIGVKAPEVTSGTAAREGSRASQR